MEITTKFNVGDFVYFIEGNQDIKKAKIERIKITINTEKYCILNKCKEVSILYELNGVAGSFREDDIFKDFEEFKNVFQLKFNVLKTNNEN